MNFTISSWYKKNTRYAVQKQNARGQTTSLPHLWFGKHSVENNDSDMPWGHSAQIVPVLLPWQLLYDSQSFPSQQ
jgi:hypothetical protein